MSDDPKSRVVLLTAASGGLGRASTVEERRGELALDRAGEAHMRALQVFLVTIWVALLVVTWRAIADLGLAGGGVFISDLSHPWRAQFSIDLLLHLLLFAVWVFWREASKLAGLVCAVLCVFGGMFTFAYLLVAAFRSRGDFRAFLLGAHARKQPAVA